MDERKPIYEFGQFRLDLAEKQLRRTSGEVLTIPPKAFDLLRFLVENPGHLLEKSELMDRVWADSFVEEGNLKIHIHTLRKTLNENGVEFIQTIPRRGYRFNADVNIADDDIVVERITRSKIVIERSDTGNKIIFGWQFAGWKFLFGAVVSAVALSAVAFWAWDRFGRSDAAGSVASNLQKNTVAVLPFRNVTADKRDDFLSVGLTDAITTRLGSVPRLIVRPTSSVLRAASTPGEAAKSLQVENLVEGSIQRIGEKLRITVQLVQSADEKILWSNIFDEENIDLLKVQDSIASNIAASLAVNLTPTEQTQLAKTFTGNKEAYEAYLKGRFFWNKRTTDDLRHSVEYFERASQSDPEFSLAYVGLSDAYQLLAEYNGMPIAEAYERARAACEKALMLNESSSEAHSSLAYTLAFYDHSWLESEKHFKRAIDLNPTYVTAHQWYGEYLVTFGRFDEALVESRKAETLDPTSPIIQTDIAAIFYLSRQYDKSIVQTAKVLELDPKFGYGYVYRWIAYEQSGNIDHAFDSIIALDSLFNPPELIQAERSAYSKGGWNALWKVKYGLIEQPPFDKALSNYVKALTALRVGETERSLDYLQRSIDGRERWSVNLKFDPEWDAIRRDPRFDQLIGKLGI